MEEMRRLEKHILNSEIAQEYFLKYLDEGHVLSQIILDQLDFKQGRFYTFLPKEAELSKLNSLDNGGILPSNPIKQINIPNLNFSCEGEWINSVQDEFVEYLYQKLLNNKELYSLTEDRIKSLEDPHLDLYDTIGYTCNQRQIYYLVDSGNLSRSIVDRVVNECPFWVFTSVLMIDKPFFSKEKELNFSNTRLIMKNIQFIFLNAYDGEGFVIWEKIKGFHSNN